MKDEKFPMRILILNHNIIEHGNYFRALKFAHILEKKGHNVTLVTSSNRWYRSKQYLIGKVNIVESPSYSFFVGNDEGWSPPGILYRFYMILRKRYDIIYGFSHKPVDSVPALLSRLLRGSFYVTDWCDWYGKGGMFTHRNANRERDPGISSSRKKILRFFDRMEEKLEEYVPKKANLVTVICTSLYQRSISIGVKEENLLHLVSGADTVNINPMDKKVARKRIGLEYPEGENSPIFIGYVANYHPDERIMLEALSKVCKKRKNIKLLAVGPDFYLKDDEISKIGLSVHKAESGEIISAKEEIIHFGRRPFCEIPLFLGASDFLLLPMSDIIFNRGRWPNKIGDYLAAGRPVVVNRVGDIPDLVEKSKAGYVAEANTEDFAEKIDKMIDDREKWKEFGQNARKAAEKILDWDSIGEKLTKRLKMIMGKNNYMAE
jgi:glycosyltransferase involved in cell wall biosynthesis